MCGLDGCAHATMRDVAAGTPHEWCHVQHHAPATLRTREWPHGSPTQSVGVQTLPAIAPCFLRCTMAFQRIWSVVQPSPIIVMAPPRATNPAPQHTHTLIHVRVHTISKHSIDCHHARVSHAARNHHLVHCAKVRHIISSLEMRHICITQTRTFTHTQGRTSR